MSTIDKNLSSFLDIATDSDFSIHNLPYGIFSDSVDGKRRAGIAIGEQVLDLAVLEAAGLLSLEGGSYFDQNTLVVCETNFKYMYWSMAQQLTHHTITGCKVEVGDMMGSGTISGPTPDSYGSMLEIAWNATKPVTLAGGETRSFIEDGDTVIMKGYSEKDGIRVGFGEVRGKVLPALTFNFDK